MGNGYEDRVENRGHCERPYYCFTKHAMERFKERFQGKFREVDFGSDRSIRRKMLDLLLEANENKSFRNSHRFMDHVYMKYGYDNVFKFMCNGSVTFIIIPKPGREDIVTCFNGTHDRVVTRHKKFKKKKKSQEKNLVDLDMAMSLGWNIGLGHEKKPEES